MTFCDNCGSPDQRQPYCPSCGCRLFEPPAGPLYRVVPSRVRPDVATRGFEPAAEGVDGQPAGVYVWDSLQAAEEYVGDKSEPHDIYELDAVEVLPDPLWNSYGAWVSPHPIPAERVRLIRSDVTPDACG